MAKAPAIATIKIGGQEVIASSVALPQSGRAFREAWQLNGNVVEIDMAKARDIKINALVEQAMEAATAAERKQRFLAAKGDNPGAAAEMAKANRFRGVPAQAAQNAIANAANPAALAAVTLDIFLP